MTRNTSHAARFTETGPHHGSAMPSGAHRLPSGALVIAGSRGVDLRQMLGAPLHRRQNLAAAAHYRRDHPEALAVPSR